MEEQNYIIAEIDITKEDINKDIKIINSYGNYRRESGNECEIYINELCKLAQTLLGKNKSKEEMEKEEKERKKKEYIELENEEEIKDNVK